MDSNQTFNEAYWAHQPPEVRALRGVPPDVGMETPGGLTDQAKALIQKGFIIDVPIMVWGWDPFKVMSLRIQYGYSSVPDALGVSRIKVSTDPADFPPFDPPAPTPAPLTAPVGPRPVAKRSLPVPAAHSQMEPSGLIPAGSSLST